MFPLLSVSTPLLISNAILTPTGFTRTSGALYPIFTLYFLSVLVVGVYIFITKFRRARGQSQIQLQYLAIGLFVSFAGGIATNLLAPFLLGRTAYTWLGPYF